MVTPHTDANMRAQLTVAAEGERKRIVRDLSAVAASPNIEQQARLAYLHAIRIAGGGDDD